MHRGIVNLLETYNLIMKLVHFFLRIRYFRKLCVQMCIDLLNLNISVQVLLHYTEVDYIACLYVNLFFAWSRIKYLEHNFSFIYLLILSLSIYWIVRKVLMITQLFNWLHRVEAIDWPTITVSVETWRTKC